MRVRRAGGVLAVGASILQLCLLGGCGDSGDSHSVAPIPSGHASVALKDRTGNAITADSTEPYSPRQTCGGCHDVDAIANGFHFQQGRTNLDGEVVMKADYFGDGRDFLLSPGMYGKW